MVLRIGILFALDILSLVRIGVLGMGIVRENLVSVEKNLLVMTVLFLVLMETMSRMEYVFIVNSVLMAI